MKTPVIYVAMYVACYVCLLSPCYSDLPVMNLGQDEVTDINQTVVDNDDVDDDDDDVDMDHRYVS